MNYTTNYTKLPNTILEKAIQARLNGTQYAIILTVWRYTYGFQRTDHQLGLSFIAKATGIHRKHVQNEINKLIDQRILIVTKEATFSKPRIIGINEKLEQWELNNYLVVKTLPGNEILTHTGSENATTPGSEFTPQETKYINKNSNKNIYAQNPDQGTSVLPFKSREQKELFDTFWELYPKKKSKGLAEKAWGRINPDLFNEIMAGLERAKRSSDWLKDNGKYVPYPATWLNAKGWEDEEQEVHNNYESEFKPYRGDSPRKIHPYRG